MSLVTYVQHWALLRPRNSAWIGGDGQRLDWGDVARRVAGAHDALAARGVKAGDRVVSCLPNGWQSVCLALAIDAIGAVESPVDVRLGIAEAERRARLLGASFVCGTENVHPLLLRSAERGCAPAHGPHPPQRPGLILWTSGTTCEPKGVVLDTDAMIANAKGKLAAVPQAAQDVRLTVLPLSHAYARTCDLVTWLISGGTLAAGDGWQAIEEQAPRVRPTMINCVPYLIDRILENVLGRCAHPSLVGRLESLGLDRLRVLGCGGAALPPERFEQIRRLGVAPIQGYGLTEAGPVVCSATPEDGRAGVVGRPIAGTELRISDTGELLCRGPGQMQGYWNDRRATAERIDAEGWLRTGDVARIEADGMVRILGRADDVIVLSTGRKISPEPIERRLAATPGVRHVVIRGSDAGIEAIVDADSGCCETALLEHFQRLLDGDLPQTTMVTTMAFACGG